MFVHPRAEVFHNQHGKLDYLCVERRLQVETSPFTHLYQFTSEANIWYADTDLNLYANNITVPGFSPIFPDAHCTESGDVCQLTTGEGGEIVSGMIAEVSANKEQKSMLR